MVWYEKKVAKDRNTERNKKGKTEVRREKKKIKLKTVKYKKNKRDVIFAGMNYFSPVILNTKFTRYMRMS